MFYSMVNLNFSKYSSTGVDRGFVFSPLFGTWNHLCSYNESPCIRVTSDSNKLNRVIAPVANVVKKALVYLAFAVTTIAVGLFSLIAFPIRYMTREYYQMRSCRIDIHRLSKSDQKSIHEEITKYLAKHGSRLTLQQKNEFTFKIMVYYARSKKVYGPVVRTWTEYLLKKANETNKKLVFLARDGTSAYKIAKKLMATEEYREKYPNLVGDKKIVLGYLSRKVVNNSISSEENQKLFQEYAEKELGIVGGEECLFIDIGFAGRMIDPIRRLLPQNKIDFEYMFSMTNKATGFIASQENQLSSLPSAAGENLGVHWLEDSHQGCLQSPSHLVKIYDRVYPNNLVPNDKRYVSSPGSLESMLRKFSQKAIVRCYEDRPLNASKLKTASNRLDELIYKIKTCEVPLYINHAYKIF